MDDTEITVDERDALEAEQMMDEDELEEMLEDVHLGLAMISDRLYVGVYDGGDGRAFKAKVDRHDEFIHAMLQWCPTGFERIIDRTNIDTGEVDQVRVLVMPIDRKIKIESQVDYEARVTVSEDDG